VTVRPQFSNKPPFNRTMIVAIVSISMVAAGCAGRPREDGYARAILDRPVPAGIENTARECYFLDSEITRQEDVAHALPQNDLLPQTALAIQKATQTNIAALRLRATQIACPSPEPMEQGLSNSRASGP